MTDNTIITTSTPWATYTATGPSDLTGTDFIRYCVQLAKAQGYMLSTINDALLEVQNEVEEELNLYTTR